MQGSDHHLVGAERREGDLLDSDLVGPGRDDGVGESLILPLAGTLELSRALEDGWQGREVKKTSVLLTR